MATPAQRPRASSNRSDGGEAGKNSQGQTRKSQQRTGQVPFPRARQSAESRAKAADRERQKRPQTSFSPQQPAQPPLQRWEARRSSREGDAASAEFAQYTACESPHVFAGSLCAQGVFPRLSKFLASLAFACSFSPQPFPTR